MNTPNTLDVIGWIILVLSWVIPYVMRKRNDKVSTRDNSYTVGMILSAIALGFFISALIASMIK